MGLFGGVVEVHSEPLKRRYITTCLSWACLLNFLIVTGAAILPLYIAHASGGLWIKEAVHYEQPRLAYQSRLVVAVHGMRGTDYPLPFASVWTTSRAANDLLGSATARAVVVRSSVRDDNHDGVADELRISASVPLAADEVVTGATVIAYVDAELQDVTRFAMDALLVASVTAGIPLSSAVLDGDVRLAQRASLPTPTKGIYSPFRGAPLPNIDSPASMEDVLPATILAAVRGRNYSLHLDVEAPVLVPDTFYPGSVDLSTLSTKPRAFEVSVRARIPPTPVLLRPRVTEELKWGWVQYLAFLALTGAVGYIFRWALFSLRIVETAVLVDAPRTATKLHVA